MTRQDMLNDFNRFTDEQLEKLITIGDSILSPMETELTSMDFASMMNQVFKPNGLADRFFPEWTDRSKSDFGRLIVELLAIFSDKDMFYINNFSREAFVGVAELYRSLFHKALQFGFSPAFNVAATGEIELVFAPGAEEFVPRGSVNLGISQMSDLTYTNEEFTIPASGIDQNVTVNFIHGKLRRENIFFDGYSIVIDTPRIAAGTIRLTIGGDTWEETDSFLTGDSSTKHFQVFYDENGRAEIMFAKDNLGAVPTADQVCVLEYIVGGGYGGDIMGDTINLTLGSQTNRNLLSYTQGPITGGNDVLPLERLRQVIIGKARHQNRVVGPEDAEYFCKELSFVHKVYADVFLNYLYIFVMPIGGGNLSPAQKVLVKDKVDPFKLMGFQTTVASPMYVPITLKVDIYLTQNTIKSSAYQRAMQTIDEYLDPLKLGEFGQGVKRGVLTAKLLKNLRGGTNVVFQELRRTALATPVDDLVFIGQEMVDVAGSVIEVNLIGGI